MQLRSKSLSESLITFIRQAAFEKTPLNFLRKNKEKTLLIPYKVLYLDGSLCVIAEKVTNKELMQLQIEEVISANEAQVESLHPTYSEVEIDDYINALRVIGETGVRLVLKLYSQVNFNSQLDFHHFAGQCVFTNPQGDIIWAATVEPDDAIFEWLSAYGSEIEILDPLSFKKKFLEYCEDKLKKLA